MRADQQSYLPAVDGLRAIAVLSVVIFHLDERFLKGGFVGVDLFFVISGYVIARSLFESNSSIFSSYIVGFYRRRFVRLFPALIVFLIITSVLSVLFIPDAWLSASNNKTAWWASLGLSNFFLVSQLDGYFSDRVAFNPFVHTWSLAVEEQFYVLFPVIFFFWIRAFKVNARFEGASCLAYLALPVLCALSLIYAIWETSAFPQRAFYLLPSRFWELGVGAMIFQAQRHRPLLLEVSPHYIFPIGLLLIGIGLFTATKQHFPFPWALVPVCGAAFLLIGSSGKHWSAHPVGRVLSSDLVTYIGRLSYSLYLWHWAVFTLMRWTVGMDGFIRSSMALIITFGLSALSYHYIENTVRRNAYIAHQASWKVVTFGVAVIGTVFVSLAALFYLEDPMELNLSVTANSCQWQTGFSSECDILTKDRNDVRKHKLFIVGDSHARAYSTLGHISTNSKGLHFRLFSRPGCSIANHINPIGNLPLCRNFLEEAIASIEKDARSGDIVFLASLRLERLSDQWAQFDEIEILKNRQSPKQIERRREAFNEAQDLITRLQKLGVHVLIDAPKPIFYAPPFRCVDWFNKMNPICEPGFQVEKKFLLHYRAETMDTIATLIEETGVHFWDPFPILCPDEVCSAFDGDVPLYFDADHLTAAGNRRLAPSFKAKLNEIWQIEDRED